MSDVEVRLRHLERLAGVGRRGRPKGPDRKPILIHLDVEMVQLIDEWGFDRSIRARVDAIRALLREGLGRDREGR